MEDNIYEIIYMVRMGDPSALNILMDSFHETIACHVRRFCKDNPYEQFEQDDLIQEGMIGLFKAIRDYDIGRDASFFTFADLCVSRQMYTAVQAAGRKKHSPLNTYISLYSNPPEKEGGEEGELVNSLISKADLNPEDLLIDKENVELIEKTIEKELSSFEKQVLDLYLTGMKYTQIAKVLGKDEKSTDNALQRIKNKLKKLIVK